MNKREMYPWMVVIEVIENHQSEYWYYGCYADRNRANEVAIALGKDYEKKIFHCVIPTKDAEKFEVNNLPDWWFEENN